MALQAPGGDRGVVDGAVQREVELDVPLEPIDLRARGPPIRRASPGESETSFATEFQWPGGVSERGPSAQYSASARA